MLQMTNFSTLGFGDVSWAEKLHSSTSCHRGGDYALLRPSDTQSARVLIRYHPNSLEAAKLQLALFGEDTC